MKLGANKKIKNKIKYKNLIVLLNKINNLFKIKNNLDELAVVIKY